MRSPPLEIAANREPLRIGPVRLSQIVSRSEKIVEYILLVRLHARLMPGPAVFPAAAYVGDRVDAAHLHPCGNDRRKARRRRTIEAAIGVQDGWIHTVELGASARGDEQQRTRVPSLLL